MNLSIASIRYMRKGVLCAGALAVFASTSVSAALVDRGRGLIYDTDLNITWLQDANYSQTSGYAAQNMMNWSDAKTWAANLVYGGYSDWRLPTALNQDGTGPCGPGGYGCTGSEMGHLFYIELGGTAAHSVYSSGDPDLALFPNIQLGTYYWSNTEYAPAAGAAWSFYFGDGGGIQTAWDKTYLMHTWVVRDGDVPAVPVPAAAWLLGSGLLGLIGVARRKARGMTKS
jgi:hypothetical protein